MLVIVHSVSERTLPTKSKANHTRNKNMSNSGNNTNNKIYSIRTIYKIVNKCNGLTLISPQQSHQAVATSRPRGQRQTHDAEMGELS